MGCGASRKAGDVADPGAAPVADTDGRVKEDDAASVVEAAVEAAAAEAQDVLELSLHDKPKEQPPAVEPMNGVPEEGGGGGQEAEAAAPERDADEGVDAAADGGAAAADGASQPGDAEDAPEAATDGEAPAEDEEAKEDDAVAGDADPDASPEEPAADAPKEESTPEEDATEEAATPDVAPADEAPADEAPVQEADEAPAQEAPTEEADEAPTQEAPTEEADEAPTQEAPTEEADKATSQEAATPEPPPAEDAPEKEEPSAETPPPAAAAESSRLAVETPQSGISSLEASYNHIPAVTLAGEPGSATLPQLLERMAADRKDKPCFQRKTDKKWKKITWTQYHDRAVQIGKSLHALGIESGDRVAIMATNRPQWPAVALGAMSIGAISTGIYTHLQARDLSLVLENSLPKLVLVDSIDRYKTLQEPLASLEAVHGHKVTVVLFPDSASVAADVDAASEASGDDSTMTFEHFLKLGADVSDDAFGELRGAVHSGHVAAISYSSGSEGAARGVMLTHGNLAWTAQKFVEHVGVDITDADNYLSYLPLAHVGELIFTVVLPLVTGMQVYFAEALEKLPENLKDVQPTFVSGVPRVWDKIYQNLNRLAGSMLSKGTTLTDFVKKDYAKMMLPSLHSRMGVNKVRLVVSSTDALDPDLCEFYAAAGIPICDMYGQTETSGISATPTPQTVVPGTVGAPLTGSELKIGPNGEIMVRGPQVFKGYFRDQAATDKVLDADGWFTTGDFGELAKPDPLEQSQGKDKKKKKKDKDKGKDADSEPAETLKLLGNGSEMVLTANGDRIPVRGIELTLNRERIIAQSVVFGQGKSFLSAVIQTNAAFAETLDKDTEPHKSPTVRESIQQAIDQYNAERDETHQVRKFVIATRPFTLDSGELTPTFKLRRHAIFKHYEDALAALYSDE